MATEDERKLFVAGLPESITEDVLRGLFETAGGTVVELSLPRDRTTGRTRGFGFVTFSSAQEAAAARAALDGSIQGGRSMSVRAFQAEASRRGEPREGPARGTGTAPDRDRSGGSDRTLYVGNLPYDCTQQQVEALFAQHRAGPVQRVHLPTGPDGRMRGFGFVTMPTAEAALAAIEALRSADLHGRRLMVNVAHPRGERPERGAGGTSDLPPRLPRESAPSPEPRAYGSPSYPPEPVPGFVDGDRGSEGRRRASERVERGEKKKKKKGRGERVAENTRRGRERHIEWDDWDEEK